MTIAKIRHEGYEGTSRVMEIAILSGPLIRRNHIKQPICRSIRYQSKKSRGLHTGVFLGTSAKLGKQTHGGYQSTLCN